MRDADACPLAPLPALEELAVRLRKGMEHGEAALEEEWANALRVLYRSGRWYGETERMLRSLEEPVPLYKLDAERAAKLFGSRMISISRLERFAGCPYQHFVQHGLRPVERGKFEFERNERGTFLHAVMHRFAQEMTVRPEWPEITAA